MNRLRKPLGPTMVFMLAILITALPAMAVTGKSNTPDTWAADYEQLGKWEFSATPITLPEGGIRLQRDTAEWFSRAARCVPCGPSPTAR